MRCTLHSLTGWMGTALTLILPQHFYGQWFFYFHYPLKQCFFFVYSYAKTRLGVKVENINNSGKTPCRHAKRFNKGARVVFTMCEKSLSRGPEAASGNLLIVCVSRYTLFIFMSMFAQVSLCAFSPYSKITFPHLCGLSVKALAGTVRSKLILKMA